MMSDETQGTASLPAEGEVQPVDLEAEAQQEGQQQEGAEGEQQADQAGETEGEKQERKRLSGAEKAKRRQTFLLNQLAEKDRELAELRQRSTNGQQSDADKPPKEEDFPNDWGAYIAAKAAHEVKQSLKADANERATQTHQAAQATELRERVADHEERCDEAREVYKDFDAVIKSAEGITIREDLAREVLFSEKSADLQYHLASNPELLHRLNGLGGRELAKEIGRLEATLTRPEPKKQTTAPAPLKPLKGGASGSFDAGNASMDDYVAKRKAGWSG